MRRLLPAVVAVLLGALVPAAPAAACSCLQLAPRDALRQADAAIVGRLIEVVPRDDHWADYRFRVQGVYKGSHRLGPTMVVRSSRHGAACGLPQQTGRRYGLLLSRDRGRWWGGLCGVLTPATLRAAAPQQATAGADGSAPATNCAVGH